MARKNTVPMSLYVSEEDRDKINDFATQHKFAVTGDLVRLALEKYMREHGENITLTVRRGRAPRKQPA